jgi:hypothetical protein
MSMSDFVEALTKMAKEHVDGAACYAGVRALQQEALRTEYGFCADCATFQKFCFPVSLNARMPRVGTGLGQQPHEVCEKFKMRQS